MGDALLDWLPRWLTDFLLFLVPEWPAETWLSAAIAAAVLGQLIVAVRFYRLQQEVEAARRDTHVDVRLTDRSTLAVANGSPVGVCISEVNIALVDYPGLGQPVKFGTLQIVPPFASKEWPVRFTLDELFSIPEVDSPPTLRMRAKLSYMAHGEDRITMSPLYEVAPSSRNNSGEIIHGQIIQIGP